MKNSVLNTEVSCFPDYYSPNDCEPVNLLTFLHSTKYRKQVEAIRQLEDKAERDRLKAGLPCITPSGLFTRREAPGLVKHSGLIQIDIDGKENQHIGNFAQLKQEVVKLPEIAYFGLSVSGKGYWGLVPIAYPHRHKEHFRALRQDFLRWGIRIDSKPGNVASLRGYSFDPEATFNHQARTYRKLWKPKPGRYRGQYSTNGAGREAEKVEACLQLIEAARLDVTVSYEDWFGIACALANEFGEAGRAYFHRASQFHPAYNAQEADRQFSASLRGNYTFTLATFYQVCSLHGITYREALPAGQAQAQTKPQEAPAGQIPDFFSFYLKQ